MRILHTIVMWFLNAPVVAAAVVAALRDALVNRALAAPVLEIVSLAVVN